MEGVPLTKKFKREVDITKCIICQKETHLSVTGTENGRQKLLEAATIREDEAAQRISQFTLSEIVYHVSNDCYKKYTRKKDLERLKNRKHKLPESETSQEENTPFRLGKTRTCVGSRQPPSSDVHPFRKVCVICSQQKYKGSFEKCRISEKARAEKFLEATHFFQDEVFTRTCDLQGVEAVFGADLYCHVNCISGYLLKYERCQEDHKANGPDRRKSSVFSEILKSIHGGLMDGLGFELSSIRDMGNNLLQNQTFTNKELKNLFNDHYGENICFSRPLEKNKSEMVFLNSFSGDMAEKIRDMNTNMSSVKDCAQILRASLKQVEFDLQDRFCDAADLEKAWNDISIPDPVKLFFCELFGLKHSDFGDPEYEDHSENLSQVKSESYERVKKVLALFQIIYYDIHNGHKRTPLHMMIAQAIHDTCKSKSLITALNHFGLSISYNELVRYHDDLTSYVAKNCDKKVPLPSHFDTGTFTICAFDNFDHDEATLSGIGSTHDTVAVLFQEKSNDIHKKPQISNTNVVRGEKVLQTILPCQQLKEFFKPAQKPTIPLDYIIDQELYKMNDRAYDLIAKKDAVWSVLRLNLPNASDSHVKPVCSEQLVPSWSAFNSIVTCETVNLSIVGFIPIIPYPVSEYSTVYTVLKNFQNIRSQLTQNFLPLTADEGVYHIAKEITLHRPQEFPDIVLCLGSFHMIKITLACIGTYIRGSGAEHIWTETSIFGVKVVESVISGSNYNRSLKGLLFLCESMERLLWCEFFNSNGTEMYNTELTMIHSLKMSVHEKSQMCSHDLENVCQNLQNVMNDFTDFKKTLSAKSETAKFWTEFIDMVHIVRDLIRADREGNWYLHLHTVQALLPLFCIFDRTNYARWCSLYLEDMRRLPETAPEVYEMFCKGKFVVKRTHGKFKAVGADMCLEQTINRSQKGTSGIIGTTKRKHFVAAWELIYHEVLAVTNLFRKISGEKNDVHHVTLNHQLSKTQTSQHEEHIADMVAFITGAENPFHITSECDPRLHNIVTKEVMSDDIRSQLLSLKETSAELYKKFRQERIVEKSKQICDRIPRVNLKTFNSIHEVQHHTYHVKKQQSKEVAVGQRILDIASERKYDFRELLKYDLVPNNFLFDANGLMTKPHKSSLMQELEKTLSSCDYVPENEWFECNTSCLVDVMANLRKVNIRGLKTFAEMSDRFFSMVTMQIKSSSRVDFVFDSYLDGSVKDSERLRRTNVTKSIELVDISDGTPLPVKMETFWPSNNNKMKLQIYIANWILTQGCHKFPHILFYLSGTSGDESMVCKSVCGSQILQRPLLDSHIEEADVRLIPHCVNNCLCGYERIVVLSNDTDVLVLLCYFYNMMSSSGLKELWMRAGAGNTTRLIPVHKIADNVQEICQVLPALHMLTGSDYTSKFGTKQAALKARPSEYLQKFGMDTNEEVMQIGIAKAEEFLVQVLKLGSECKTMDELRVWVYHNSKTASLNNLPPTSYSTREHIMRSFYATHVYVNCLKEIQLQPTMFSYVKQDGLLLPFKEFKMIPPDLVKNCSCKTCDNRNCGCRRNCSPCCKFCRCQISYCDQECMNPFK